MGESVLGICLYLFHACLHVFNVCVYLFMIGITCITLRKWGVPDNCQCCFLSWLGCIVFLSVCPPHNTCLHVFIVCVYLFMIVITCVTYRLWGVLSFTLSRVCRVFYRNISFPVHVTIEEIMWPVTSN